MQPQGKFTRGGEEATSTIKTQSKTPVWTKSGSPSPMQDMAEVSTTTTPSAFGMMSLTSPLTRAFHESDDSWTLPHTYIADDSARRTFGRRDIGSICTSCLKSSDAPDILCIPAALYPSLSHGGTVSQHHLQESCYADAEVGDKGKESQLVIEQWLVPWITTKNFLLGTQGKAILQLYVFGWEWQWRWAWAGRAKRVWAGHAGQEQHQDHVKGAGGAGAGGMRRAGAGAEDGAVPEWG
ncbi:hypothetical protein JB92DRAFT_2828846 [Gautieria morchelliformis]|nr:hypothetical protein JB92DRAFT_2828846 [Gautieria morchelliformis]